MPAWENYDLAEAQFKGFTRSEVRTKIMLCLKDGELAVGDLEKMLGIRASTILHSMKELIETDIAIRTIQGYSLTNIGKVQSILIDELMSAIVLLDQRKKFWLTHDVSGIPDDLLARIGMIAQSEILEGDPADVLKTQAYFVSELIKSKEIYGISPIIIPEYPAAISAAVQGGAKVDLILTEPILDIIRRNYRNMMNEILKYDRFRLFSIDRDVRLAFTVTDSILSLGLFRIEGGYDVGADLNCFGERARSWGMELFKYYRDRSSQVQGPL